MILLSGYELTIIVLVSCIVVTTLGLVIYYLFVDDNNNNSNNNNNLISIEERNQYLQKIQSLENDINSLNAVFHLQGSQAQLCC
jgi:flagellar basal body-associated protein FliL